VGGEVAVAVAVCVAEGVADAVAGTGVSVGVGPPAVSVGVAVSTAPVTVAVATGGTVGVGESPESSSPALQEAKKRKENPTKIRANKVMREPTSSRRFLQFAGRRRSPAKVERLSEIGKGVCPDGGGRAPKGR
jgi:hypothetical protein